MLILLPVAVLAAIIYYIAEYWRKESIKRKYDCQPVKQAPLVTWYDIFGIKALIDNSNLTKSGYFYQDIQKKLDSLDTTTLKTTALGKNQIITIEPENFRTMCSSADLNNWTIGTRPIALKPLLGNGIFSSEGESWKHSRIMLRPIFAKEHIKQITAMESYIQLLIKVIKIQQQQQEEFDLQHLFHCFTIDYATDFLFGESCDCLKLILGETSISTMSEKEKSKFAPNFDIMQYHMTKRLVFGYFSFLVNPPEFQNAVKHLHEFVFHFVDRAINFTDEELNDPSKNYVFLYQLAKQTKDRKVILDELLSVLLAGRNTTASLLSFMFFELAQNKPVWNKLKQEINQHFPDVESITFDTINNCEYLRWCIHESLRINPPVPINTRTANKDTVLPKGGGKGNNYPIFVRKGEQVIFPLFSSNRQERFFGPEPEKYIPERWANLPRNGGIAFGPFGTGPRLCLGQQLALVEASYVTIRLLQTFSELDSNHTECRRLVGATMRLMDGCQVTLK